MNDGEIHHQPEALAGIIADSELLSFGMLSEVKVGFAVCDSR